jgi:hypothetical protein
MQWWNDLLSGQAVTVAMPHEPPQHEPPLRAGMIMMMDFTSSKAQTKRVAPTTSDEEGHTKATTDRPLNASPPPTTNDVNKMYHQLVEIHALIVAQLAECTADVGLTRPPMWLTPALIHDDPPQM